MIEDVEAPRVKSALEIQKANSKYQQLRDNEAADGGDQKTFPIEANIVFSSLYEATNTKVLQRW